MREIREVVVFSHGDSEKLSTWSNVPYFFTQTLEKKGVRVRRVDINPYSPVERFYDGTIWRVINKLLPKGFFTTYLHTGMNHWLARRRIRRSVMLYPGADAFIFLSFSHSIPRSWRKWLDGRRSRIPVVLFCDWTIDYYFRYFLGRKAYWIELPPIRRQDRLLEDADLVISLFPGVAAYMREHYQNRSIRYLGNVVNSELTAEREEVIGRKKVSGDLLFIGGRKYRNGALCLVTAFGELRKTMPELRCHIIGMEAEHLGKLPEGVICYGYLDKARDDQRQLYYTLMEGAKVVVNTTEKWGAFSSTIEAMYFYTPVITSAYQEFVETFGEEIDFGYYCNPGDPDDLSRSLSRIFNDKEYTQLCLKAHDAVLPFGWEQYMDRLLESIRALPH